MSDIDTSSEIEEQLIMQFIEEKTNSLIYQNAGMWCSNIGLSNIADFFFDSSHEEERHARKVLKVMSDLNIPLYPKGIEMIPFENIDIKAIANILVNREKETTASLNELKKLAIENDNPIVEDFARRMIKKQQLEMEESNDFYDKIVKIADGDLKTILLLDSSM